MAGTINGSGQLTVDRGKLIVIPFLERLSSWDDEDLQEQEASRQDQALMKYLVQPGQLEVMELEVITPKIAVRGDGLIHYDGRLQLRIKTVLLDSLTRRMGRVGEFFEELGEDLVTYDVSGTYSDPTATLNPLGLRDRPETEEAEESPKP